MLTCPWTLGTSNTTFIKENWGLHGYSVVLFFHPNKDCWNSLPTITNNLCLSKNKKNTTIFPSENCQFLQQLKCRISHGHVYVFIVL